MRKNLITALFVLYGLTMLIPAWWPFNFRFPPKQKPYFESLELTEVRYRWQLEKDVLKLAMFIPIGILLVVMIDHRKAKLRIFAYSVLGAGVLSALIQEGRYFLPNNSPNLNDVFANTAGALLGASVIYFSSLSRRMLGVLTIVCIACFVVAATWPDHFSLRAASLTALSQRVEWSPFSGEFSFSTIRERALNGLMMLPLGLLAATYSRRTHTNRQALIWTTWLGFGSSVFVEFLQCFLPYRTPSLSDISLNTLGTLAGGVIALYLVNREMKRLPETTGESDRGGC